MNMDVEMGSPDFLRNWSIVDEIYKDVGIIVAFGSVMVCQSIPGSRPVATVVAV